MGAYEPGRSRCWSVQPNRHSGWSSDSKRPSMTARPARRRAAPGHLTDADRLMERHRADAGRRNRSDQRDQRKVRGTDPRQDRVHDQEGHRRQAKPDRRERCGDAEAAGRSRDPFHRKGDGSNCDRSAAHRPCGDDHEVHRPEPTDDVERDPVAERGGDRHDHEPWVGFSGFRAAGREDGNPCDAERDTRELVACHALPAGPDVGNDDDRSRSERVCNARRRRRHVLLREREEGEGSGILEHAEHHEASKHGRRHAGTGALSRPPTSSSRAHRGSGARPIRSAARTLRAEPR